MSQPQSRQAHTPSRNTNLHKPSFEPRRICIMGDHESKRFEHAGLGHRCSGSNHPHYTRSRVMQLVQDGILEWVGKHHKIAKFAQGRTWKKVRSGPVSTMQFVPGGAVMTKTGFRDADRRAETRSEVKSLKAGTLKI